MNTLQLHKLMSLTEEAIDKIKDIDYSTSIILRKKFVEIQDELYGKPIK